MHPTQVLLYYYYYHVDPIIMYNVPSVPNGDGVMLLIYKDETQQDYQLILVEMFPNGLDQSRLRYKRIDYNQSISQLGYHTDGILANSVSSSLLHKALFIVMVITPGWSPLAASIANLLIMREGQSVIITCIKLIIFLL